MAARLDALLDAALAIHRPFDWRLPAMVALGAGSLLFSLLVPLVAFLYGREGRSTSGSDRDGGGFGALLREWAAGLGRGL
jgi:hypothetical protein